MDVNSYVSFMYDFAITLMGSEEAILDYLGIPHNYKDYLNVGKKPSGDADDEAFDEEEEEEEKTFMQKWSRKEPSHEFQLFQTKWKRFTYFTPYSNIN